MAVTWPNSSTGQAWDVQEDYTDGFAVEDSNITAYSGSAWNLAQGSTSVWAYNGTLGGFANANTVASYYIWQPGGDASTLGDWDDIEVLALVSLSDWTGSGDAIIVGGRNTDSSGTGYGLRYLSTNQWDIFDFDDAVNLGATDSDVQPADNDLVWMRIQMVGTAIKGKAWIDGDSEPAGWQCEASDSTNITGYPLLFGPLSAPSADTQVLYAFAVLKDPSASVQLAAAGSESLSTSATLSRSASLQLSAVGALSTTATLARTAALSAAASESLATSANLTTDAGLAASGVESLGSAASLTLSRALVASPLGSLSSSATLTRVAMLVSSGVDSLDTSAVLGSGESLAASALESLETAATLTRSAALQASTSAALSASGILTLARALSASASASLQTIASIGISLFALEASASEALTSAATLTADRELLTGVSPSVGELRLASWVGTLEVASRIVGLD